MTKNEFYRAEAFRSQDSLGYLLKVNHSVMHNCAEQIFSGHDVSFVQWIALLKLSEGVRTASDLCRHISHDNGAVTRMIDHLEKRGYVYRERSTQDRRVIELHLTDAGHSKIQELMPLVVNTLNEVLQDFSLEEFARLIELLKKLETSVREHASKVRGAEV